MGSRHGEELGPSREPFGAEGLGGVGQELPTPGREGLGSREALESRVSSGHTFLSD